MAKRCVLIVLDSLGVGALPDAPEFGDAGSNTLGHICDSLEVSLPNMASLGLGLIGDFKNIPKVGKATGAFGRMAEQSPGKDTTTGHWELMGVTIDKPFNTFPNGFPAEAIAEFERRAGVKTLCNRPASGTEIINQLGQAHVETGALIVYTSADPVFQIAAHESVVPIARLYELCELAFEILTPLGISRVIARPFEGEFPNFSRTYRRRDFSVNPPSESVLDALVAAGHHVASIGKIGQIYAGQGISSDQKSKDNDDGMTHTIAALGQQEGGLIFTNLVDFDMKYGHRRDPIGYGKALMAFDGRLPELMAVMRDEDLLILTADHGNDPTYRGTDHTREYVPVMVYGHNLAGGQNLGTRECFADLGATVASYLGVVWSGAGSSFLGELT